MSILVYRLGSTVSIGPVDDAIEATVTGVAVYPAQFDAARVQYQVAYWNGRTRTEEWLDACEVRECNGTLACQIGFSNGA